jgi:hypothetical protein
MARAIGRNHGPAVVNLLAVQRVTPQMAATWNQILEELGVIFVLFLALGGVILAIVRKWFAPWYVVTMLEKRIEQLEQREQQLIILEQDIKQIVHEIRDNVHEMQHKLKDL